MSPRIAGQIKVYRPLRPLWEARPRPEMEVEIRPKRRGEGVELSILDWATEASDVWDFADEDAAKAEAMRLTGLPRLEWRRPR